MTDRRPSWVPQIIDLNVPSAARIYDYFLGGSHNFEVDRQAAEAALQVLPGIPAISQENRNTMRRSIRFAAARGITQFLDIGSGIPTFGNVHEIAQTESPGARVVYVDNDPVAVAHSRAVLEGNDDAAVAAADLRDPETILKSPEAQRLLDFDKPIALMLVAIVHFLADADRPADIIATLRDALAPGSIMVITHATLESGPTPLGQIKVQEIYRRTATPLVMRTRAELEPLFDGFEIVEPGIVPLPFWRPDTPIDDVDPAALHGLAGVGVK